jgi:hypothetical protein
MLRFDVLISERPPLGGERQGSMATAAAPRGGVYLSLLAGRAITALADLSEKPTAWSEQIKRGLEDGLEYCRTIGEFRVSPVTSSRRPETQTSFKRLATQDAKGSAACAASGCKEIERLLTQLLSRSRKPKTPELVAAIEFFAQERQG